jgi:L-aminopeptidase/D-esterase-like protein
LPRFARNDNKKGLAMTIKKARNPKPTKGDGFFALITKNKKIEIFGAKCN